MLLDETDSITEAQREELLDMLVGYNLTHLEDREPREVGIFLRDQTGDLAAGLIGETHGNWLEVELLWVTSSLRGGGLGSMLLDRAEEIASQRKCDRVFLNTFSFQAPEFYRKRGYREVLTLDDYPRTGKKHFFIKQL